MTRKYFILKRRVGKTYVEVVRVLYSLKNLEQVNVWFQKWLLENGKLDFDYQLAEAVSDYYSCALTVNKVCGHNASRLEKESINAQ